MDGKNPTLLNAYGGFHASQIPTYLGAIGKVWTEKNGIYVLANVRGGDEFGPMWHDSAVKENRYKVYDDFAAVTEDLFKEKNHFSEEISY